MTHLRLLLADCYRIWTAEHPARQAAALAYYSMFALAPILYVGLRVAGLFVDQLLLTETLDAVLIDTFGNDVAAFVRDLVVNAGDRTRGGSLLTTLISTGALLYAASGLFVQLKHSLNAIWQAPAATTTGVWNFLVSRVLAFALVIGLGALLVVAVFAGAMVTFLQTTLGISTRFQFANLAVMFGLSTITFAVIFKVLPDTDVGWRHSVWGAMVTTLLVGIGGSIVILYLRISNAGTAFEAAGSLAVLLIGIYYTAQLFLAGAVFTRALAESDP